MSLLFFLTSLISVSCAFLLCAFRKWWGCATRVLAPHHSHPAVFAFLLAPLSSLLSSLPLPRCLHLCCVFSHARALSCACSLFSLPVLKQPLSNVTLSNVAEGWGTAGGNAQADGEAATGESAEAGAKLDQLASQVPTILP
jgi:hypothetical protein